MSPQISIIMSVYWENQKQLQRAIGSILEQSFSDFECIIVLDNPTNFEAKQYILKEQKTDTRIIFLENERNIKLWASLNKWISVAKGKYIARMDGDDICDASKLEKQFQYLEKHSEVDLLFTWWEQIDEKWKIEIRIPLQEDFQNIKNTFFYKSPLLHASMMCRKEVFEHHRYPEIDRPEDFWLFLALIANDYSFDVIPEKLYTFFVDKYDSEKKYQKIRIFSSNYLQILWKNIPHFFWNIYFWWMFTISIIQWVLSRNQYVFDVFFGKLQDLYKHYIISDVRK